MATADQNTIIIKKHQMLYLKISFGKEIHLLTKEANFVELLKFIRESFKNLPNNFEITYRDADGDNISISNDEDVRTLYATSTEKFVKIAIVPLEEEAVPEPEVAAPAKEELKTEVSAETVPEIIPVVEAPVPEVVQEKAPEPVIEVPVEVPVVEVPVSAPVVEETQPKIEEVQPKI